MRGRRLLYASFVLIPLTLCQCKPQEQLLAKTDGWVEAFEPTLVVDSPMVAHQYEGNDARELLLVEIEGDNQAIPQWAFAIVPSLVGVKLNPGIRTIEDNAFFSCKKLAWINLNNVWKIGENSFKNTALETINLSKAVVIKEFAFANCTALRDIILSNKLKSIGDFAFSGDTALVSCHIPSGDIGASAFMGCYNLKHVSFGKANSIGNASFLDCKSLIHVVIPPTIKSIGTNAFSGCTNLKEAVIISKDTKIAENAFEKDVTITYKTDNL